MNDKMTPMPATQVAIIGTGTGTGDGSGGGGEQHVIETPAGQPNILVSVVSPLVALSVRFVDTYLTTLVAVVSAGMTTSLIPATDFLDLVRKAALLSVAGAGFGLLKDLVTVVGKLRQKFPLLDV